MDLIYTDRNRDDVGVLKDYKLDLAFGADENDFELIISPDKHCCTANSLIYIENSECGGIIDQVGVVSSDNKLSYYGRTWHGVLGSKIIEPDQDQPYLIVSGEANTVLGDLITRLDLTDLFTVSSETSTVEVNKYRFDRYIDGYTGISKMLTSVGGKLKIKFMDGKAVISAVPIVDYSQDDQFDNDKVELDIQKTYNVVNHLICLGKGELTEREVVHLYLDRNGKVSNEKVFFGAEEITATYDLSNAESSEELKENGVKKLEEYANQDKVQLNLTAEEAVYDVGDIVGSKELITNTFVSQRITKKIVTIENDMVNIQYKVGE